MIEFSIDLKVKAATMLLLLLLLLQSTRILTEWTGCDEGDKRTTTKYQASTDQKENEIGGDERELPIYNRDMM